MKQYEIKCPNCGKLLDKRNPGQILSHGVRNSETGEYECHEEADIPYSKSNEKGDSVEWTKDGKRIDLN